MTGAFTSGWQLVGLTLIVAIWTYAIWRTAHPHQPTPRRGLDAVSYTKPVSAGPLGEMPVPPTQQAAPHDHGRARSHVHTIHTPRLYDWENDQ
jgi:hypothetical protein